MMLLMNEPDAEFAAEADHDVMPNRNARIDLSDPRLFRLILQLAIPSVVGLSINALQQVVNAIFVGTLGAPAIAAVSMPDEGGNLRIWSHKPIESDRKSQGLETTGYPFSTAYLEDLPYHDFQLKAGDIALIDGGYVHVDSIAGCDRKLEVLIAISSNKVGKAVRGAVRQDEASQRLLMLLGNGRR